MQIIQRLVKLPQFRIARNYSTKVQHGIRRKDGWESVIGLEVHAQIAAKSKIFSSASTSYGGPVNSHVALLDSSIPGTLPVLNKACVEAGVLTAMALSCQINNVSTFDRKHYFYSDLPAGYQITQQRNPLASKGSLEFVVCHDGTEPYYHTCKIHQLQLEQDSGKSLHDDQLQRSLIDLNRAGVGLMEIVFEPDLRDGEEAAGLIKELILILEKLETCNCKMEEGALRIDANISVNRIGEPLGIRTEVKNLGSIRAVAKAIEYEVVRQIEVLESGGTVMNETRSFDVELKQTVPMRDKEMKQDYRFMPEPNLPPLRLSYDPSADSSVVNITSLKKRLKELPDVTRKKLTRIYGLSLRTAMMIINMEGCLEYFLSVMKHKSEASSVAVANYLLMPFLIALYDEKLNLCQCTVDPKEVADIVTALESNKINFAMAAHIGKLLVQKDGRSCAQIIKDEGLEQVDDDSFIEKLCQDVIEQNEKFVRQYNNAQSDKKRNNYKQALMDVVFKAGDGKLNMKKAKQVMERLLDQ